ncbi:MAG TPA: glycoside hydrolase family 88 protein [Anaeromyxobacter sp.]|nr:glycoside hydrolase family 88 protein [Anaeromyxobacter sp.]
MGRDAIPWDDLRGRPLLGPRPGAAGEPGAAERCQRVRRAMLAMQRAPWEQGLAAQACLEEGEAELTLLLAREAVLRQDAKGRLSQLGPDPCVTDPAAAGEAVIFAALETGERRLQEGAERMLDYLLSRAPRTADGVLLHLEPRPEAELWIDSMYMAPPFLALAGQPDEALRQVRGLRRRLWREGCGLFAHRFSESRGRFEREAAWGVGNGWAAAGMLRTLRHLPSARQAEREELAAMVREVLAGCLARRRADGLFHDVLDDPSTFVETNLAQMLAWTIYRGVEAGVVPRPLLAEAGRMRAAVLARVDPAGLVQGVCGSPLFDRPGTAAEGQAFFLMMEAARRACPT